MSDLILTPAYGRDYKSKDAVLEDYNAGKDFVITNVFHPHNGQLISKRDIDLKIPVKFRYDKLRKAFYL